MARARLGGIVAVCLGLASVAAPPPARADTAGAVPDGTWLVIYNVVGSAAVSTVVQSGGGVTLTVDGTRSYVEATASGVASLRLDAPAVGTFSPGAYPDAVYPQVAGRPGIQLDEGYTACSQNAGSFTIHDIAFVNGALSRLDATFVSDCLPGTQPAFGELRYDEPVATPVALQAATVDFPPQYVGVTNPTVPISVTNTSTSVVPLGAPVVSGTGAGDVSVTADTCASTLLPGASCTITVAVVPTGTGPRSATLSVTTGSSPATVTLDDTGIGGNAALVIDEQPVGQGVGTFSQVDANQFNAQISEAYGGQWLTVTAQPATGGTFSASFEAASGNLVPGSYSAQSATAGPWMSVSTLTGKCSTYPTATFTISALTLDQFQQVTSFAADAQVVCGPETTWVSVRLASYAAYTAVADQPASAQLYFANQPANTSSAPQPVVETNAGTVPVTVSASFAGIEGGDFQVTPASCSNVQPGSSCSFGVSFHPHGTGQRTAILVLTDTTPKHTRYLVVTGVGTGAAEFVYPADQQLDVLPSTPFSWSPIPQAQHYLLVIGTKTSNVDVLDTGPLLGNQTSYTVPALPAGTPLGATLFVQVGGTWYVLQSIGFEVQPSLATFDPPFLSGYTVSRTAPIEWSPSAGGAPVNAYYLVVGTVDGADDVINSGVLPAGQTSYSHPPLPANRTLYGYIFTFSGGKWFWITTTFNTGAS